MLVASLGSTHNLVLNKFAIVPEHFILATKAFKEQTNLLERDDLETAYACIEAYHAYARSAPDGPDGPAHDDDSAPEADPTRSELFVFFNSGASSGASQPHRHLQLLPVARMREGLNPDEAAAWDVLAQRLVDPHVVRRMPFQTFVERIHPGADLEAAYLRLYRRACQAVLGSQEAAVVGSDADAAAEQGTSQPAAIDYNLAMTRDVMVIAPRLAEGAVLTTAASEDGGDARNPVGMLSLNGTVLAGTALVKSEAEWDALRAEPGQLLEVLGRVGVPNVESPSPA
jgi:ATP adenylyltransferase